jgi:uncharacterized GH25 family protein
MTIGYGHAYPFGGFLPKDKTDNLSIKGPSTKSPGLTFTSDLEIKSSENIAEPGVYVVTAEKKPGFYTKTAEGGKQASKKGLKNVLKCSYSHAFMKALVNVGDASGDGSGRVDAKTGQVMEIVPLKNPRDLRSGATLPVLVLYKGKPWTGELAATYAGFSTEKDSWAAKVATGWDGKAGIPLNHGGYWIVRAVQEEKYPDCSECDVESYGATLTFELK